MPQNDPHDALIILNIHKWGDIVFKSNLFSTHQLRAPTAPRSDPEVESGVKNFFLGFSPIFEFSKKKFESRTPIPPSRPLKVLEPVLLQI